MLKKGSILLTRQSQTVSVSDETTPIDEGICLKYENLQFFLNTTEDNAQEIFVKLKEMRLNLASTDHP